MSKVTVIVGRHGEKNKDALTTRGAMQIYGMALLVKEKFGAIKKFRYSGANRTHQCATISAAAMEVWDAIITKDPLFHFDVPFKAIFNSQMAPYEAELKVIVAAGGSMKEALEISEYTRVARKQITQAILEFAATEENGSVVTASSHGSYGEFAIPERQLKDFPYQIPMGSAIAYTVEDGVITNAEFIPAVA